jgi:hypothetical protein
MDYFMITFPEADGKPSVEIARLLFANFALQSLQEDGPPGGRALQFAGIRLAQTGQEPATTASVA